MSGLVNYASSDEDDDIGSGKPAKVGDCEEGWTETCGYLLIRRHAKTENNASASGASQHDAAPDPRPASQRQQPVPDIAEPQAPIGPAAPPPSADLPPLGSAPASPYPSAPGSPYTLQRQQIRELTMPPVPTFDIPNSPPPPAMNSEDAARLAGLTKKFERFLELKKQGVHFNEKLLQSTSLRNPSLLPKLMDFAGITREDSYASALPDEIAVPTRWPEGSYAEHLVKVNERREKKRLAERDKIDFLPAANASVPPSIPGTPSGGGVNYGKGGAAVKVMAGLDRSGRSSRAASSDGRKKTRFDER